MNKRHDFDPETDDLPSDDEGDMTRWMLDELDEAADLGSLRQTYSSLGADARYD